MRNPVTFSERLRAIREEKPARTYTVTRALTPSNRHVEDSTIAAERVLERPRKR